MLATALATVLGYDKASKIAHDAPANALTLKAAALQLGVVAEGEFDGAVDPGKMAKRYGTIVHRRRPGSQILALPGFEWRRTGRINQERQNQWTNRERLM
jgi:Fumarase C C-terminus